MNTLIDTSIWSLSLRRRPQDLSSAQTQIVSELTNLIAKGHAHLLGLVRQEVLSGVRSHPQFERLKSVLKAFHDLQPTTTDHEFAAVLSNRCQAKGVTVSVVDALICSVAVNRDWAVFTTDSDFQFFAKVIPIRFHSPQP